MSILLTGAGANGGRVQSFLNATGITDPTIIAALNGLNNDLINANLISKFIGYAIYPMVGGTSNTTKYNFMDARDSDAAFRITWSGGLTFAATGVTPNGVNGYGNTHINNNIFAQNNLAMGVYSRTNVVAVARQSQCAIGAYNAANSSHIYTGYASAVNSAFPGVGLVSTTSQKHFAVSRINGTNINIVTESGAATSTANASVTQVNAEINIFRLGGFAGEYDVKESAFNYVCLGLTTAELDSLTTIITNFETALGRNV